MTYKDSLKKSQNQSGERPRLDLTYIFETKGDDGGTPCFRYWDKEACENKYIHNPINGIFIGSAMKLSIFDDSDSKGMSYNSDYYFSNNKIALFNPFSKDRRPVVSGTKEDIEKFAADLTGNIKKCKTIFLYTKQGLVEISTNLTIAIDQLSVDTNTFLDNEIILTPALYDPEDETISAGAKKWLGKFAPKNPPKYANITIGDHITLTPEEEKILVGIVENFDKWCEFKKSFTSKTDANVENKPEPESESDNQFDVEEESTQEPDATIEEDDLPF